MKNLTDAQKNAMKVGAMYKELPAFIEKYKEVGTEEELTEFWNEARKDKKTPAKKVAKTVVPDPIEESEETSEEKPKKAKKAEKVEKTKEEKPARKVSERVPDILITKEMQSIIDDEAMSKANKFRKLHELGMSIAQITRTFDTYYSFVESSVKRTERLPKEKVVVEKPAKESKKAAKKEEAPIEEVPAKKAKAAKEVPAKKATPAKKEVPAKKAAKK